MRIHSLPASNVNPRKVIAGLLSIALALQPVGAAQANAKKLKPPAMTTTPMVVTNPQTRRDRC
jgi:hypothetical protein